MESLGETLKKERSRDGLWEKKYHYEELKIGESIEVTGVEGNIRSAATMWGTRYGIWLQVAKIDDGVMRVTRIEAPLRERKKKITRDALLDAKLDAIVSLQRLILERLDEIQKA